MLRARFPLAVAALAAAVALVPASSASAASSPLGSSFDPSQVQDALGQLGGGSGGSGTPDVGGAFTDLTGCLADAGPTTPPAATQQDTSSNGSTPSTESVPSNKRSTTTGTQSTQSSEQSPAPSADPLQGLTGQSASSPTILAADDPTDGITDPLDAGQQCIEDFLASLGAKQAKCFSANHFTAGYLGDKLSEGLSGQPPSEADLEEFQTNLTNLLSCLSSTPESSEAPAPPVNNGGGASTPTASDEAAPATAVTGTPNFTG